MKKRRETAGRKGNSYRGGEGVCGNIDILKVGHLTLYTCCSEGNEGISGSRVVFTDSENPWLSCLTSK